MTHSILKIYNNSTDEIIERNTVDINASSEDLYFIAYDNEQYQQCIKLASDESKSILDDAPPRTLIQDDDGIYCPVEGLCELHAFANRVKRTSIEFVPLEFGFEAASTNVIEDMTRPEFDIFDLEINRPLGDPASFIPLPDAEIDVEQDGYYHYVGKSRRQLTVGHAATCAVGMTQRGASAVDVMVKPIGGSLSHITIETAYLNDSKFIEQLAKLGVTVDNPKRLIALLNKQRGILARFNQQHLLGTGVELNFVALEQHGFNRVDGFYVYNRGDKMIKPAGLTRPLKLISGLDSKLHVRGSLSEWHSKIFEFVKENTTVLGAMYLALSSILLEFLPQVQSMMIHYSGASGSAKTSMMQLVSTLFGNGSQSTSSQGDPVYIKKHASTINGLEVLFIEYTGKTLILDEIGATDVELFGNVLYLLADEQSKQRMGYESKFWRTNVLSTGEVNIKSLLCKQQTTPAGQLNRILEVYLDSNIFGATIDASGKAEELPWVSELMLNTGRHYGSAAEAFINALVDTENVETVVQEMQQQALARIGNVLQFGEARVLKTIAAAEVAARIAAMHGILPVSEDMLVHTIDTLVEVAVKNIKNAPLAVINFVRDAMKHNSVGKGIRTNGVDDVYLINNPRRYGIETILAIRKDAFDPALSKDDLTMVRRELWQRGYLIKTNGSHYETIEKSIPIYAIKYTQAFKDLHPDAAFWADFESVAKTNVSETKTSYSTLNITEDDQ